MANHPRSPAIGHVRECSTLSSARDGEVPPSSLADFGVFALGAAMQFIAVYWAVPAAMAHGLETMPAWMLVSVPLIFLPIIAASVLLWRCEGSSATWIERLRFGCPSRSDFGWGMAAVLGLFAGSGVLFAVADAFDLNTSPPFAREVAPLTADRWWIAAIWLVYWPINILSEELAWRGVILPRMERRYGERAWLINAASWLGFHLAFGPGNNLILLPTILLTPWAAQRTKSTWIGGLIHTALSLPGFIALALGLAG